MLWRCHDDVAHAEAAMLRTHSTGSDSLSLNKYAFRPGQRLDSHHCARDHCLHLALTQVSPRQCSRSAGTLRSARR